MSTTKAIEPCDCTCRCGDDPRIGKGHVNPCPDERNRRLQIERTERIAYLLRILQHHDLVAALEDMAAERGIAVAPQVPLFSARR